MAAGRPSAASRAERACCLPAPTARPATYLRSATQASDSLSEFLLALLLVAAVGIVLKLQSLQTDVRLLRAETLKGSALTPDEEADVATGVIEPTQIKGKT